MEITNFLTTQNMATFISSVLSVLVIFLQLVYVVYAFMVTRQVKLMNRSFETPVAPLFTSLAFIHFMAALLIVTLTILVA